jgi:hypothetical protein
MTHVSFDVEGRKQKAHRSWYRGDHTNYNPNLANMRSPRAIEDFILNGWLPAEPFITSQTKIAAFGSCFAEHISNYLNKRNYTILTKADGSAYVVRMGEGIVNSYAIRQQFDWAFRGLTPTTDLWHGYDAEDYGYDEAIRLETLSLFESTDVFILTFGLSEVWYDEPTGEVFWRAIPADVFDPSRHKFRVTTVGENMANMRAIYETIREFRPDARIIFTLSPIPLVATFRPVSCITANTVSKSVLRAAIDELHREVVDEGKLFYWPSYDIVEYAFGPGKYEKDRRHIKGPVLDYVMALFESHYCADVSSVEPQGERRIRALEATGEISPKAIEAAEASSIRALSRWVRSALAADDIETADLVVSYSLELHPGDAGRQDLLEMVRMSQPRK